MTTMLPLHQNAAGKDHLKHQKYGQPLDENLRQTSVNPESRLARIKAVSHPAFAELLGTLTAVYLGVSFTLSWTLQQDLSENYGPVWSDGAWSLAFLAGRILALQISGAHLNPAFSIASAITARITIAKCLVFVCFQLVGGFMGSLLAFMLHQSTIHESEINITVVARHMHVSLQPTTEGLSAFFIESFGTALLFLLICTLTNRCTWGSDAYMSAINITLMNTIVMLALGCETGPNLNPARDTGPRLLAFWLGETNAFHDGFWWYGAWLASVLGGTFGLFVHDKFFSQGDNDALLSGPRPIVVHLCGVGAEHKNCLGKV